MDRPRPLPMLACLLVLVLLHPDADAQKRWDGGAGDGLWASANNWSPDGVPAAGDDVLLDNAFVPGSYAVSLPAGNSVTGVNSVSIRPSAGDSILLDIPFTNTAIPALDLSSTADALVLDTGALLRNGSGAASGETILLSGRFRINDGGHYMHRTPRANAYLIDHLVADSATVHGIFEFDVPGSAGYTVSLTGNTFGDLRFSATAAGGAKSYSGSGTTDLNIRGHLLVGPGAVLTSTLTADVRLGGDLVVEGKLDLRPVTTGTTGRSLLLSGTSAGIFGNGSMTLGANFRNIEALQASSVMLHRDISLPFAGQTLLVRSGATIDLDTMFVNGNGSFLAETGSSLRIGDRNGLTVGDSGNLRTTLRQLDTGAAYIYTGTALQRTGDALPPSVARLAIDKPSGHLMLTRSTEVRILQLLHGDLYTTDSTMITIGAGGVRSLMDRYGRTDEGWEGSHVSGPCTLRCTGPGTWRAPIGAGQWFAPLALQRATSGETRFTCTYHIGIPLPLIDAPATGIIDDKEYWVVSSDSSAPDHDTYVDLSWRSGTWPVIDSAGAGALHVEVVAPYGSGMRWIQQDQTPLVDELAGVGWVHSDRSIDPITVLTLGMAMPMNLLGMTGMLHCQADAGANILHWTGALPVGIELHAESSMDGLTFSRLPGLVRPGSPYRDEHRTGSDTWYRLSYEQGEGEQRHSNTCLVRMVATGNWRFHPQPATDHLYIEAPGGLHQVRYRMMDMNGTIMQEGTLPDGKGWDIALVHMAPGIRILQVFHSEGVHTSKVLVGRLE